MSWHSMDQAARNAAYDNRAAVADAAGYLERWTAASARLRSQHPQHLDLAYGSGARCAWDLFPALRPDAPCLVFIHGGYWQRNSREAFACVGEGVRAHGWAAALPGYTLAPEAGLTQIVSEIRGALDWLAQHGGDHGIRGPVVLSGWSAGGHLTAAVLDHPRVKAGLAISGIFDLGPIRDTNLNDALQLTEHEIASLSPLRAAAAVRTPLTVAFGTAELPELQRQSREFHGARQALGAPGRLLPVHAADHFSVLEELRRADGALVAAALMLAAA